MDNSHSQNNIIITYLQDGNSLTALEALKMFKCFRLASRINEIKNKGHKIKSEIVSDKKTGKRYARYFLGA